MTTLRIATIKFQTDEIWMNEIVTRNHSEVTAWLEKLQAKTLVNKPSVNRESFIRNDNWSEGNLHHKWKCRANFRCHGKLVALSNVKKVGHELYGNFALSSPFLQIALLGCSISHELKEVVGEHKTTQRNENFRKQSHAFFPGLTPVFPLRKPEWLFFQSLNQKLVQTKKRRPVRSNLPLSGFQHSRLAAFERLKCSEPINRFWTFKRARTISCGATISPCWH